MIFNHENFVKNLPDCYAKNEDSNNSKLLEVEKLASDTLKGDISDVLNALDIDQATGKTLDLYGAIIGQQRGLANDTKYALMIKAKIMRNLSAGDFNSVIKAIAFSFNCNSSEVQIKEADKPCTIELVSVPLDIVEKAELTQNEIVSIVMELLPIGVGFDTFLFNGTFEFSAIENEADDNKGFADDQQTIGGYFGNIANMDDIRTNALGVSMFANFKLGG